MGVLSSVFVISGRQYKERLIPAIHHLAASGHWPDWIQEGHDDSSCRSHLTVCEIALASLVDVVTSPAVDFNLCLKPGLLHREIMGCPPEFHGLASPKAHESICVVFTRLLLRECGIMGLSFGRQKTSDLTAYVLNNAEVNARSTTHLLLRQLGHNLMPLNEGTGGYLEGVCGRLSSKDCQRLSIALSRFQHPKQWTDTTDKAEFRRWLSKVNEEATVEKSGLADLQALSLWASLNGWDLIWINDPPTEYFKGDGRYWYRLEPLRVIH